MCSRLMFKRIAALIFLLTAPVLVQAQHLLSPPERPPVPLSDADQQRMAAEEASKKPRAAGPSQPQALTVNVPLARGHSQDNHVSSGNLFIDSLVREASARHGLDPCLVLSVMKAESGFNKTAVSVKGASGLMQLMPATAARFGVKNIFDQRENIHAGARYLRWLLNRFGGDVRLALAGYNAGEGAVEFYGYKIPPYLETQNYVRIIYGRYSRIHGAELPPSAPSVTPAQASVSNTARENIPTYNQIVKGRGQGPEARGQ
jgi:soluble lytic murein transglycosylase-like protein